MEAPPWRGNRDPTAEAAATAASQAAACDMMMLRLESRHRPPSTPCPPADGGRCPTTELSGRGLRSRLSRVGLSPIARQDEGKWPAAHSYVIHTDPSAFEYEEVTD